MTNLVHPEDKRRNRDLVKDLKVSPGPTTDFGENFYAAAKQVLFANSINAETGLKERELAKRANAYEKRFDDNVVNYLNPPISRESEKIAQNRLDLGSIVTEVGREFGFNIPEERDVKEFYKKMDRAYKETGDPIFNISKEKLDKIVAQRARKAEKNLNDVTERSFSSFGWAGRLSGSMSAATMGDPLNASTLSLGAAKGLSLLKTFALETGIEGGIEVLQQPKIQSVREDFGLQHGPQRALTNVAMAGLGGGILGTSGQAFGKAVNKYAVNTIKTKLRNMGVGEEKAGLLAQKINDEGMNEEVGKEITQEIKTSGGHTTETEAVRRILETKDMTTRMNPYVDNNNPKVETGRKVFNENLEKSRVNLELGMEGRKINTDGQPAIKRSFGDEYTEVNRNEINRSTNIDIDRGENDVTPVIYKTQDGKMELIEGDLNGRAYDEADANNVKSYVINESNNVSREEAQSFVLGRRLEQGRANKKDIADFMGVERSELNIPDASTFVENVKKMTRLNDAALKKTLDENISAISAAKIADKVDNPDAQVKALEQVKAARTPQEADDIIQRGLKEGFDGLDSSRVLNQRQKIINKSLDKLRSGEEKVKLSDGTEVDFDDELLTGLRRLSRQSSFIQQALTRSSTRSLEEGSIGAGSDEFIESIRKSLRDGPLTRDDLRAAGISEEGGEATAESLTVDAKFSREKGDIEQSIVQKKHPLFDEINQRLDQDDFDFDEVPDLRSDDPEKTVSMDDLRKEWEQDEQAIKSAKDCLA